MVDDRICRFFFLPYQFVGILWQKPIYISIYVLKVETTSVELLFQVQWFVVTVQQNLTDRGVRVPTLTPVDEWASHAHFLASRTVLASHGGAGLVVHSGHPPHLLTHRIHKYQVDIGRVSMLPCSFRGMRGEGKKWAYHAVAMDRFPARG